jgi:ankyrin repeat protein
MRKNALPRDTRPTSGCHKITRPSLCFRSLVGSFLITLILTGPLGATAEKSVQGIRSILQSGDLHALVVGVSKFRDPGIPDLKLAASDAKAFGEFLEAQQKVFKKTRVTYLINAQATKSEIEKYLYYTLPKAGKNDTIILFFSGHGAYDPMRPKDFLFLAYDSEPDYVGTSAVKMTGLDFLKNIEAERVLIIADACHSGKVSQMRPKGASPSMELFLREVRNSSGKAVITSGKADQLSWELPNLKHSVFTYNLLEGLKGNADRDHDGVVTLNEVYGYAYRRTKNLTAGHQHPQFEGKIVGAFPLSHIGPPLPAAQLKKMFLDASRSGDVQKVDELVHATGNVNCRDHENDSPLIIASRNGNPEVVKLLLTKSADISGTNSSGDTALTSACQYGHLDIAQLLLEAGSDCDTKNGKGFSPLAAACSRGHVDIVKLLIDRGANIQCRTNSGKTPLIIAASAGNQHLVKLLLDKGADPAAVDLKGNSTLSVAARRGCHEVVKLLLEKGARICPRKGGFWEDQLVLGILRSHMGRVKEALSRGANVNVETDSGDTPLTIAVGTGDMKILEHLVSNGADVNRVPRQGYTPLMTAAGYGRRQALQLLLDQGADPNLADREGNSPLMVSALNGRTHAVTALLEKKADLDRRNTEGCTALMLAAENDRRKTVRLLLEAGADPNIADKAGNTALMKGAGAGHLEVVRILTSAKAGLNARNNEGRTALILATQSGHEPTVSVLLKAAADASIVDWEGKTAAAIASERGLSNILSLFSEP